MVDPRWLRWHLFEKPQANADDPAHWITGGTAFGAISNLSLRELTAIHNFDHDSGNYQHRQEAK